MTRLLQYRLSDGSIYGMYEGLAEYFAAQIVEDDPVYGYLEDVVAAIPMPVLFEQWYIVEEVLTAKAALTITATPTPFDADGVAECLITVDPFVECTLVVNETLVALTTGDDTLALTSDVPATFTIALQPMATHWAAAITVEAT
jgi:hypothetical protein